MSQKVSYTQARDNLAEILNQVEESREIAVITRRGHEDMALIPLDELESLRETAYLLRSPANAARLLTALSRGRQAKTPPSDLAQLRAELGFNEPARK